MGWSSDEPKSTKKKMETSTKILIAIIACVLIIITLILVLLLNIQTNTFNLLIDAKIKSNYDINKLITRIDDITYINIEEFAKLVGYEYHGGEYKSFTIEEGKCYVQGSEETATFYANDNKVCKLPVNLLQEDYREYKVENTIKTKNDKMYAPIEAISLAFNVSIGEDIDSMTIYTLDYLVKYYNNKVTGWGYSDITEQSFENKKAILYGYLIVNKEKGLYKIIDDSNSKEIVPDKYTAIEFSENTQEFLVTNSLGQVGIINLDGSTKIEPTYDSISVLNKSADLYLIQKNEKYGVVKSGNVTVIVPEYDDIGLNNISSDSIIDNKYFLLDKLIPVSKVNKWGAFDKNGKLVLKLEYDRFGCPVTSVEINDTEKAVEPVITIDRCKGIVVEKDKKYGVLDLSGKEMVPIAVENIYAIKNVEDEDSRYFMIYNGEELNVIERLIIAGFIEPKKEEKEEEKEENNIIENNIITVDITENNTVNNQIGNNSVN